MNPSLNDARIIRDHGVFRMILGAMSHPGSVFPVPELEDETESLPLLLGCLMDAETGFSVIGDQVLAARLGKITGARPLPVDQADFIIAPRGATQGLMPLFKRGTLEYPDLGATVIYRVETLGYGELTVTCEGPGVDGETELEIGGMDRDEFMQLRDVNLEFPLGVDVILLDRAGRIAAMPRSTRTGV